MCLVYHLGKYREQYVHNVDLSDGGEVTLPSGIISDSPFLYC